MVRLGAAPVCRRCHGLLEYIYHIWWQCKDCGRWEPSSVIITLKQRRLICDDSSLPSVCWLS
jgi:hypothetical protein